MKFNVFHIIRTSYSTVGKMDDCVVKVVQGLLKGSKNRSVLNNKEYFSFKGIPYAEPPVGSRRFKDPEPISSWSGIKDATQFGSVCLQFHEMLNTIVGHEDCLFLNVYSPQINTEGVLKPVMVYIHGGGFTFGSGDDEFYGPDYLIEHDIVLVTLNYRVGVFGFLTLGNKDVPGNAGLKDQCLALRWVQENIQNFGGDPKNVTIFGESAGAASVQYHTLSPMSRGLFHRVIMQSGSVLNPWAFFEDQVPRAYKLCEILGKKAKDPVQLLSFLREQPGEELLKNQGRVLTWEERRKLAFSFVPCREIAGTGSNFLVEHPETLLKNGLFADVPYIIGMNDKEGLINLKEDMSSIEKLNKMNSDLIRFVPHDLYSNREIWENVASQVKKFYLNGAPLSMENFSQFMDMYADFDFTIGISRTLRYLSQKPNPQVYVYLFMFEGNCGYLKAFLKKLMPNIPKGVCHADDLGYLFHNNFVNGNTFPLRKDSKEVTVINHFCILWTNFARKGDPNGSNVEAIWKKNEANNSQYLQLGEQLEMVNSKLFPERVKFWNNLYASTSLSNKL